MRGVVIAGAVALVVGGVVALAIKKAGDRAAAEVAPSEDPPPTPPEVLREHYMIHRRLAFGLLQEAWEKTHAPSPDAVPPMMMAKYDEIEAESDRLRKSITDRYGTKRLAEFLNTVAQSRAVRDLPDRYKSIARSCAAEGLDRLDNERSEAYAGWKKRLDAGKRTLAELEKANGEFGEISRRLDARRVQLARQSIEEFDRRADAAEKELGLR